MPGGFAEYIRVPGINVDLGTFILPQELSFEEGSFVEPVACVVRGQRLARLNPKQSVLVIGSGISGLLHVQLARARGAERVVATDINDFRLKLARSFGADATLLATEDVPARLREVNNGRMADLVVVCTGAMRAIQQALQSVERGGTLLFFAPAPEGVDVPIPLYELWRNEVTLTTSYAGAPQDIGEAIDLLQKHRIRVREMITHRLGLSEAGLGFRLVTQAQDSMKVLIEPQRH